MAETAADRALAELLAGNQRFVKGQTIAPRRSPDDFRALANSQSPIAVVIGCADSRVPPEILFDAGVGDMFVARVAGTVIDPNSTPVKGSIEYAVAVLNVPLVLVLGHTNCGAVQAAIRNIDENRPRPPGAIGGLVDLIKPAVARSQGRPGDLLSNAVRANVEIGVARLRELEPIIAPRVREGTVKVVGAVYDLHDGTVRVLE